MVKIDPILCIHQGGVSRKWCLNYDIGYNNGPLAILCHVVYATLGLVPVKGYESIMDMSSATAAESRSLTTM